LQLFDTVLITAASEPQAEAFRRLIARRKDHGLYPREIAFEVVADPPGGRVGTGGGTLWALARLLERRDPADAGAFLENERILLVHAGGESRRLPCYAPEGKLFAPLPLPSSALLPPVVLDAQLGLFFKYPWRRGETVVTTADVYIDFDVASVPEVRSPVFGFAKPASLEQGSRHGVFRFDQHRERVVDYYQKAPVEVLAQNALIEGTGDCALDIGLVSLGPEALQAFLSLGASDVDGASLEEGLEAGRIRFDLYLEVLTACLKTLSFEAFWERVGAASALPEALGRRVYETFHPFGLGGALTRSTTFVHVGSLAEFPRACRDLIAHQARPFYEADQGEIRPSVTTEAVIHNSVEVSATGRGPASAIVEACSSCSFGALGGDNLLVGLHGVTLPFELPRGTAVEERRIAGDRIVVIFSAGDSFKVAGDHADLVFCGRPLDQWLGERGLTREDVFDAGAPPDLFDARLFCCEPSPNMIAGYLTAPDIGWGESFRAARRLSLHEIQARDDVLEREDRRVALRRQQLRELFGRGHGWQGVSAQDFESTFGDGDGPALLREWLERTDDPVLRAYRECLYRTIAPDAAGSEMRLPEIEYVSRQKDGPPLRLALKEDQIVWTRSPVRLDLAGGWTDTPPYTLRHGGRVVNLAVDLNGQPPIQVFCRRTPERHVRIHSIDLGHTETFTRFDQLQDYNDPSSAFALPRAALCLMGLGASRREGETLEAVLDHLGSGLEITLLCAVPKGSGLGTSSILGAVMLAAFSRFFGRPVVMDELIRQVLQVEQMLTTGGGWQDQIGGAVGGIKCVQSRPGFRPHPVIHQLDPFLFQDRESLACFSLFYTGITRLAKNILAEVVGQVNSGSKAYRFTLQHMAQLALDAKDAIERRDRAALAGVLALSWEANKRVHPSTTNPEVEEILSATRAHYGGVKLLGAGGGGYALFASPDPAHAEALREVLRRRFENERARLVDFSLSTCGLEVSAS
jgi:galactokinase/mevalonate kinase-like predicted kinase